MAFMHKKNACPMGCVITKWVVCILLLLVAVAALIGVYQTHVLSSGIQFGSTSGSLAILSFSISISLAIKQMMKCMGPCEVCSVK